MESHERSEKCREAFAMLSDYLNLELPPETCEDLQAHIAGCPPCIEFVESLRKTVDLCRHYQPSELPEPIGAEAREQLMSAYQRMLASRKSV